MRGLCGREKSVAKPRRDPQSAFDRTGLHKMIIHIILQKCCDDR